MAWPSIREYLCIPEGITGEGVGIAIVDGKFPCHPDIAFNNNRNTYVIKISDPAPQPEIMVADHGPWNKGKHGLSVAAAAAGSGFLSQGQFAGAAPKANLYLLETGSLNSVEEIENKYVAALEWLHANWRKQARLYIAKKWSEWQ